MLQRVMPKVRAIVFHAHGDPAAVARVEELELAAPQPNEARVRILFAPINPADLNVIEGKYPLRPSLPAVPGMEGVHAVTQLPSFFDLTELSQCRHVIVTYGMEGACVAAITHRRRHTPNPGTHVL